MSIGCMMSVWANSQAKGNDRLILLAIADEANDEGANAFPSMRRLANKANCHTDTAVECVKSLEALGELFVQRPAKPGRGRFNRYTVLLGKVGNSDPFESKRGLVTGSVRVSAGISAPKRPPTRAKETTNPNQNGADAVENPASVDNFGSESCDLCESTGWIETPAGSVRCSCDHRAHHPTNRVFRTQDAFEDGKTKLSIVSDDHNNDQRGDDKQSRSDQRNKQRGGDAVGSGSQPKRRHGP